MKNLDKVLAEYNGITDELGLDIELEWGLQSRQYKDFVKIESYLEQKLQEAYEQGRRDEEIAQIELEAGADL